MAAESRGYDQDCVKQWHRRNYERKKRSNAIQIRYIRTVKIQAQKRDPKSQDPASRILRNYLFKIFDKLGVSTSLELVLYFLQERQSSNPDSDA